MAPSVKSMLHKHGNQGPFSRTYGGWGRGEKVKCGGACLYPSSRKAERGSPLEFVC